MGEPQSSPHPKGGKRMSFKFLDVYVNNLGNIVSTDFNDETVIQYSNNFIVRILAIDNYFDTVTMNILQPNGVTLSSKQLILQPEKIGDYFAWSYRLSQLDTSVVTGSTGQLKFTFFLNVGNSIITTGMVQIPIQQSVNSEVIIGDPTSLNNLAENVNNLSEEFIGLSNQFDQLIELGGVEGPAGQAATITVGTTTTLLPGANASVNNSGTSSQAVFNFLIPRGATGATGPTGATGAPGPVGATPLISVGSVLTGIPGSGAVVSISGTAAAPIFNFTIPAGEDGMAGVSGVDGREVELQKSSTHIQWRYVGDFTWNNLVPLSEIKGEDGETGREIELQNNGTHIQWRYVGDVAWTNLVALTAITGPKGDKGDQGETGMGFFIEEIYPSLAALLADTITIGHFGLVQTADPANVDNGKLYLYSSTGWTFVADMSVQGIQGPEGSDGREVSLRVADGFIQWQYTGDASWTNLISLSALTGPAGSDANVTKANVEAVLTGDITTHNHDSRYYTETEVNQLLTTTAPIAHTHVSKEVFLPEVVVSASKTLALSDNGTLQKVISSNPIVITIPLNSTAAFPLGTEIVVTMYGLGSIQISAVSGVTFNSNVSPIIGIQYSSAVLRKMGLDEWVMFAPSMEGSVESVNGKTGVVVLDANDVGAAQVLHNHTQSQITDLTFPVTSVNGKTGPVVLTNIDVGAAATSHTHTVSQITDLVYPVNSVNGKTGTVTLNASDIAYSNIGSDLLATTTQGAIDELDLKKADVSLLTSNLILYPTTAASDISNYSRLVSNPSDLNYNITAVNVPTGQITSNNQLVGQLIADAGLFVGNPGIINVVTVGNIRKTSGSQNQFAEFFFRLYKRNQAGTEELLATSETTGAVNPSVLNQYFEFSASALLNNGVFLETDRVVLKFFANTTNAGATYDFQFGGATPVRTLVPVPASVIIADQAAKDVLTNTTNFNGILSNSDDTVQKALDTIDNINFSSVGALSATDSRISNWDAAFGWGNHAGLYPTLTLGKIDPSVLPDLAITNTSVVSSEAAMLALNAQVGDVAVRTDLNKTFILKASPATTLSNWQELLTPTDSVLSVNGEIGNVVLNASDVGALSATDSRILQWDTAYGWGDHSQEGYLKTFTELDPVFTASPAFGITSTKISNWDTAYGWDDHALAGYLTTETDPTVGSHIKDITTTKISNWDAAFSWGDHSTEGYLKSVSISNINATGTPSSSTFLRGDGAWETVTAGVSSVNTKTGAVTLNADDIASTSTRIWNNLIPQSGTANSVVYTAAINPEGRATGFNVGNNSIAFGANSIAQKQNSISIGNGAASEGENNILIGSSTVAANQLRQIAIGHEAVVNGADSIQLGKGTLETSDTLQVWTYPVLSKTTGKISSDRIPDLSSSYAALTGGKIDVSVLPAIALTDTFTVSSESAMLALTAETGDIAIRTDVSKTFVLSATPATTLANWKELLSPTGGVTSVNGQTGVVTLTASDVGAAPTSHSHNDLYYTESEIDTFLLGKANAIHDHGNITSGGKIGTASGKPIITGTEGLLQAGEFGTTAGTFVEGNDSRLSDARTPTAHTHVIADVTDYTPYMGIVTVSSSKTLELTDANKLLKATAAVTITIPADSSINFPINTEIAIAKYGSGNVTIAESGVTLNSSGANPLTTQFTIATLKKIAANEWLLVGPVEASGGSSVSIQTDTRSSDLTLLNGTYSTINTLSLTAGTYIIQASGIIFGGEIVGIDLQPFNSTANSVILGGGFERLGSSPNEQYWHYNINTTIVLTSTSTIIIRAKKNTNASSSVLYSGWTDYAAQMRAIKLA